MPFESMNARAADRSTPAGSVPKTESARAKNSLVWASAVSVAAASRMYTGRTALTASLRSLASWSAGLGTVNSNSAITSSVATAPASTSTVSGRVWLRKNKGTVTAIAMTTRTLMP